jgi:3-phenylpropionate/trans-cinnamate dioxygenase ferredoxin reductase subunit
MYEKIVIVGAGQAAAQAIDALRRQKFAGSISLVGQERLLPYQRPPLSKKYLAGSLAEDRLLLRPAHFYESHGVSVHVGRRVLGIDRRSARVRLDTGTALAYDALLLATGSVVRRLNVPGMDLPGVHVLRTSADADRLRAELIGGRRLVIIGGGYIGLEVAATARGLGAEVTVLEVTDRVMSRVAAPAVSEFFAAAHRRHGVRIEYGACVSELAADDVTGRVRAVLTADGAEHAADLVLVCVGVIADSQLAADAQLECDNGIRVDAGCRTSDAHIYAAGDCTEQPRAGHDRPMRLESVDNAIEQGIAAATALCGAPPAGAKGPGGWCAT